MSDQARTISVESEGEQEFLVKMQRLFRKSLQAGRDAKDGERFDSLHSVVVVKGPDALAALTESATTELLAEAQKNETNLAERAPCSEPAHNEKQSKPKPAAGRQKRGSKSTNDRARS